MEWKAPKSQHTLTMRPQNNDLKRQFLMERLLDAVKQCQIRFGGRKEIASDSDSRVICLCAQFESVLQHGLKRSRGLALTAAAIKQAAGFASKTETDPVFWVYVKEILNKHELQRFHSLKNITTDIGRGRAWLRCALNEHSLERYLHMLLGDPNRLGVFYEDWSFLQDEERSSILHSMAADKICAAKREKFKQVCQDYQDGRVYPCLTGNTFQRRRRGGTFEEPEETHKKRQEEEESRDHPSIRDNNDSKMSDN
ncbi:PREDICTED: sorting nexin-29-like [Nanorana parkeri]|uniref:sorting nexin-29-like n=1 Tax=Nanorana parkeri TaxID=125878 RepID=UPI0008547E19|nr:PREDICTED: sorting nexin-29-like [Nanorana parkeri]